KADVKREKRLKWIIAIIIVVALAGTITYFSVRTWGEERVVKTFLDTLDKKDFQGAYKMWGCTQDTPCRNYDPGRFNEDWGPSTVYAKGSSAEIAQVDFCDTGVVFLLRYPNV